MNVAASRVGSRILGRGGSVVGSFEEVHRVMENGERDFGILDWSGDDLLLDGRGLSEAGSLANLASCRCF